jgi:hypothetical protein
MFPQTMYERGGSQGSMNHDICEKRYMSCSSLVMSDCMRQPFAQRGAGEEGLDGIVQFSYSVDTFREITTKTMQGCCSITKIPLCIGVAAGTSLLWPRGLVGLIRQLSGCDATNCDS